MPRIVSETTEILAACGLLGKDPEEITEDPLSLYPPGVLPEIRWSHGKFNSKPEAKLYKEFAWQDVCLFESLL